MSAVGRPTVMTPEIIAKLEAAFIKGATDKEAIFLADISSSAFYHYCEENPDFKERKESLKEMVKYRARSNVAEAIEKGDKDISKWYLERKAKDEFSQRSELTGSDGSDLIVYPTEEIKSLTAKLNAIHGGASISSNGDATGTVGEEA